MARVNSGFVKLHRRMLDWGWYQDTNTFRLFIHLLLTANYEPGEYRGHKLRAGDVVIGRKALAKTLGMSEQEVRTALNHLKSTNEITITVTNRFSVAHIENWRKYQAKKTESTSKSTSKSTNNQPTSNQQATTYKERKERKERKEYKESTALPPDLKEAMQNKLKW